ncbi:MAG: AEC family transporter [Proteobacteria bacterium]|nr:MAG: AEC family transporter [Pseudomonadota bacterium]
MLEILSLVIPFFAVIGCGYAGARLIGETGQRGINNLVLYFALPTLLFAMMARSDIGTRFQGDFVTAYTSVSLVLFAVAFATVKLLFRPRRGEAAVHAMGAVYGNTGYMGIPIVVTMLGQSASVPIVVSLIIDLAIMVPLTAAIVESDDPRGNRSVAHGAMSALRGTIRNPLILASALGAAWSLAALPIPVMLGGFLDLLGAAAAPCALFAMGCSLYGKPLGGTLSPALLISVFKLVIHPIVLWFALTWIWTIDPEWTKPALIAASLPVAVTVYVVARQYNTLVVSTSTTILVSTSLSLVSVPVFLLLLDRLPGI